MIHEVNVEKNIDIIREMNDAEYAQALIDKEQLETERAAYEAKQVEEDAKVEAKKAAKAQALAALGLSQEVINLLAD